MSEKILVTGGAGYLGSIAVPALLEAGYRVRVLDNFMYRQTSLLDCCANPNLEILRGDARDEATMAGALKDVDIVLPLAALVGAPLCDMDQVAATTTNLEAIRLLLRLKSREQRLIMPTTNSGYGIGEEGKECTEETPLRPISLYGRTKVDAEAAVLDEGSGLTLRLATVFGASPRMRVDLLVNDFVHRAVSDRTVVLFQANAKRNYIHVRDVARAFMHALSHYDAMSGEPYNVGLSDANLSKLELCEEIREHVPKFVFLEAPIGEDPDKRDYIVSNAKIEATGYAPKYSLADGITELKKVFVVARTLQYRNA